MSDEHIGVPFPRDSIIDHLAAIPCWDLQHVIEYEEKDNNLALWSATFEIRRGMFIPSAVGTVTISEMKHKWAIDGKDPLFTLYGMSFWRSSKALGNQFLTTKNADDFAAIAYTRLEVK